MKYILLLWLALIFSQRVNGQTSQLGEPLLFKDKIEKTKNYFQAGAVDNEQEVQLADLQYSESGEKIYRFGKEHKVAIDILEEGIKTVLPNGDIHYQYGIYCKNAISVNLIFDQFQLPAGARLYIVDMKHRKYDGAYTHFNNNRSAVLGTEVLYNDRIIVEVVIPKNTKQVSKLQIGTIVHGFRNLDEMAKGLNSSGTCEVDVNCPLGQGWENQRNSVAMMVNGGGFCTGSLVNNTSGDIIPYFLTARHCGVNPAGWVFRFRWESPADLADCGTASPSSDGPTNMNVNGGSLCSNYASSDFTLALLNQAPNPAWGVYYNGWDRTNVSASQLTGIHHPSGDIKKISRDNSSAVSSAFAGTPANSHWKVPSWDDGVTEGGSSGSPLFNQDHRTIGQLHGGDSYCGASVSELNDTYGKFFISWDGGGTDASRLSNWLDPSNIGSTFIDGIDPNVPTSTNDAGLTSAKVNLETLCGGNLTPKVSIYNSGTNNLTAATIFYGIDGATNLTYNWTGNLPTYAEEDIILPSMNLPEGYYTFKAFVVNSTMDDNLLNDTTEVEFRTVTNGEFVHLALTINCYADENSWQIIDNNNQYVVATGDSYSDASSIPILDSVCLAEGCYTFTLFDSYGDGLSSQNECENGSYDLTVNALVVGQLLPENASFGSSISAEFCIGTEAGLAVQYDEQKINVYPNPAGSVVTVSALGVEMLLIEIVNLTGKKIYSNENPSTIQKIELDTLAKGMYMVRIATPNGMVTKQLAIN